MRNNNFQVGNLVLIKGIVTSIHNIDEVGVNYNVKTNRYEALLSEVTPIMLTEYWIEQIGFKSHNKGFLLNTSFVIKLFCDYWSYASTSNLNKTIKIKYVHELQQLINKKAPN